MRFSQEDNGFETGLFPMRSGDLVDVDHYIYYDEFYPKGTLTPR